MPSSSVETEMCACFGIILTNSDTEDPQPDMDNYISCYNKWILLLTCVPLWNRFISQHAREMGNRCNFPRESMFLSALVLLPKLLSV